MGREMGRVSGWGTHVHPWQIQVNVWQNQYNIVKSNKQTNKQKAFKTINTVGEFTAIKVPGPS